MAKYDVYRDPRGSDDLLVCIQSNIFDEIDTRVAIPLLPEHPNRTPLRKLNPVFVIAGRRYALYTQMMLSVPASVLRDQVVNIAEHRDEITASVDLLFQGF